MVRFIADAEGRCRHCMHETLPASTLPDTDVHLWKPGSGPMRASSRTLSSAWGCGAMRTCSAYGLAALVPSFSVLDPPTVLPRRGRYRYHVGIVAGHTGNRFPGSGEPTLGTAVMEARQAVASQSADPTWFAYTVFGDPRHNQSAGTMTVPIGRMS